ncbi:hypothetical protein D1007_20675 [Hordeum vulgare]|nr:hypothetical protein D1007_20675 [Hordeum vulgare]
MPPPPPTMANFELDPELFVPPGHNIIDAGPDRLPRTYTMPSVPITRRHERYVIVEVLPTPPADNMVQWYLLLLMKVVGGHRRRLLMEEDGSLRQPQKHHLLLLLKTRSPW